MFDSDEATLYSEKQARAEVGDLIVMPGSVIY